MLTPEEFCKEMENLRNDLDSDEEVFHICADGLICDLLRELGYGDGVDVFESTSKWYC